MTEIRPLLDLAPTLLVPAIGYGVKLLWDIREHLRMLNGRVTRMEAWKEGHEQLDEERRDALRNELHHCPGRQLWEKSREER